MMVEARGLGIGNGSGLNSTFVVLLLLLLGLTLLIALLHVASGDIVEWKVEKVKNWLNIRNWEEIRVITSLLSSFNTNLNTASLLQLRRHHNRVKSTLNLPMLLHLFWLFLIHRMNNPSFRYSSLKNKLEKSGRLSWIIAEESLSPQFWFSLFLILLL